jgi:hypothetical protein
MFKSWRLGTVLGFPVEINLSLLLLLGLVLVSFGGEAVAGPPQPWRVLLRSTAAAGQATPSRRPAPSPPPSAFALRQNHPNPFTERTAIRFELPIETDVRLEVFDAQGRRVQTLANGQFPAGFHAVEWDQRDAAGRRLGPGVYLYRIHAGSFRDQKKMVLLP